MNSNNSQKSFFRQKCLLRWDLTYTGFSPNFEREREKKKKLLNPLHGRLDGGTITPMVAKISGTGRRGFVIAAWVAIPPTIYRTPELGFPETAADTAGEGNCWGNSGCWGECRENCCGDCREECHFSIPQSNGTLPGSLCSSSPSTAPSTPSFPSSFPGSVRSSFGKSQHGGPVDGRGNGNAGATPRKHEKL